MLSRCWSLPLQQVSAEAGEAIHRTATPGCHRRGHLQGGVEDDHTARGASLLLIHVCQVCCFDGRPQSCVARSLLEISPHTPSASPVYSEAWHPRYFSVWHIQCSPSRRAGFHPRYRIPVATHTKMVTLSLILGNISRDVGLATHACRRSG